MALMLVGVWLANYSDTRFLIGLLLGFGAAAGSIVLARRENSLPLTMVKEKGGGLSERKASATTFSDQ